MEFVLTEYLRMSGVYWGLTCLELMGRLDAMDSGPIIEWLLRCQASAGCDRSRPQDSEAHAPFLPEPPAVLQSRHSIPWEPLEHQRRREHSLANPAACLARAPARTRRAAGSAAARATTRTSFTRSALSRFSLCMTKWSCLTPTGLRPLSPGCSSQTGHSQGTSGGRWTRGSATARSRAAPCSGGAPVFDARKTTHTPCPTNVPA